MKRTDPDLHLPDGYSPERDGGTAFSFADEDCYPCFALGSTWNGFDNVTVSGPTRDVIVARWSTVERFDPETRDDLAAIAPDGHGRVCLGWGYATQTHGDIETG